MGIHGFFKLIKNKAPAAIRTVPLSEYRGKTVAIDAILAIYQWCSVGAARNIRNPSGKYINHVQGLFFRTIRLLEAGITPVYVFDGPPPASKEHTRAVRQAVAGRTRVPQAVYEECKRLMDLMGIKWITAPSEAEAQAAAMTRATTPGGHFLADIVGTEDSDALVFGARCMVRGLETGTKPQVEEICLDAVLRGLKLNMAQFVDLCILMGSDHTETTLPGIGPVRALVLVQKYSRIEDILRELKIQAPRGFDYKAARDAFLNHDVDTDMDTPTWNKPDAEALGKLKAYLLDVHELDAKKVENGIEKLSHLWNN